MKLTHNMLKKASMIGLLLALIVGLFVRLMTTQINAQGDTGNPTTEAALAVAVVPDRDLNELALRLGGVAAIPAPPTAPERIYAVGDTDTFFVHGDFDVTQVNAELIYINDVVYMWFEPGFAPDIDTVQTVADRFANEIYPQVRSVFGSESSPGVDGDVRLHILHTDIGPSVAGYFYSLHQYNTAAIAVSNQREMFFMAPDMFGVPNNFYLSVLAHEFQHMIQFNVDGNEDSWMDEGLAELSAYEAGFGPSNAVPDYLSNPSLQLSHWPDSDTFPIYGAGFLFNAYLREQYGVDFIRTLVADPANGMAGVQNTLSAFGIIDPFSNAPMLPEHVFSEWTIANFLGDVRIYDGRYGYSDPAIQEMGTATIRNRYRNLPLSVDATIQQWSANYYQVDGAALAGQTVSLTFEGNAEVPLQPTTAHSGSYGYWSHRTNQGDTRLTANFDLTGVDSATLSYWAWYDIEEEWDWLYVLASPDGGQTWDILQAPAMTDNNPFGTGYGYGHTGLSRGWLQQEIDLGAYAGSEISVRFEYVTDDSTLGSGFLLDDVSIPEIGFFDDFENPTNTWTAEGWVLSDNRLPQHFSIHLVQRTTDGVEVLRLLDPHDDLEGTWALSFPADIQDAVLVVSAYAPLTSEPATISLELR